MNNTNSKNNEESKLHTNANEINKNLDDKGYFEVPKKEREFNESDLDKSYDKNEKNDNMDDTNKLENLLEMDDKKINMEGKFFIILETNSQGFFKTSMMSEKEKFIKFKEKQYDVNLIEEGNEDDVEEADLSKELAKIEGR